MKTTITNATATYTIVMLVFASLAGSGTGPLPLDSLRRAGFGPLRALALCLGLLSLAGIPPAPGFWAKLAILGPAWSYAGIGPTIVAVIGGVAGALYYLKPLPDLFAAVREGVQRPIPAPALASTAVALAGLTVIAFGLAPALAYLLASLATYSSDDPGWSRSGSIAGALHNYGGPVGAYVADLAFWFFGYVAYTLPLVLGGIAWISLFGLDTDGDGRVDFGPALRLIGIVGFLVSACGLLHLVGGPAPHLPKEDWPS